MFGLLFYVVVGVSFLHVETGHRKSTHGDEVFAMHSVFKLPIAITVLGSRLRLEDAVVLGKSDERKGLANGLRAGTYTVGQLLEAMLVDSDNAACDRLLGLLGGPRVVGDRMRALGVPKVVVDRTEKELGEGKAGDTATPDAMVALLEKLARGQLGLSPAQAGILDDLMAKTRPGRARIAAGLPAGTALRHRTGTSATRNGVTAATNDVGVVTMPDGSHLVLAVFVKDAKGDEAMRDALIAAAAREAYDWAAADR